LHQVIWLLVLGLWSWVFGLLCFVLCALCLDPSVCVNSKFQVPSSKLKDQSPKTNALQFPPVSAVAFDEFKRRLWSPRTSFVVGKIRCRIFPVFQNRRHDLPTSFNHIAARVERRIAQHAIKQQTLVGLGRFDAERRTVTEVHVDRAD